VPKHEVGSEFRWVREVTYPENRNAVGIVLAVIPNDATLDDFTMYDIEFSFGNFSLCGTQIEAV
jgi:hypothetical protein